MANNSNDLDFIKNLLSDTPQSFDEKLKLIKEALQNNTYTINAERIAEGLSEHGRQSSAKTPHQKDIRIPEEVIE